MMAAYDTRLPSPYASAHPSSVELAATKSSSRAPEPVPVTSGSPNGTQSAPRGGMAAGAGTAPSGAKASGSARSGEAGKSGSAAPGVITPGPRKIERPRAAVKKRLGFAIDEEAWSFLPRFRGPGQR